MSKFVLFIIFISAALFSFLVGSSVFAQTSPPLASPSADLTQKSEESASPLQALLEDQTPGPIWPFNPLKYAIRSSVAAGVPANTIVLILLLPLIAAIIASTRHIIGIRGFGIFLPAALSVTFLATGAIPGLILFLIIVSTSTATRILLRKAGIKLQYLPRMALILWMVAGSVLAALFLAPLIRIPGLANVSIFPVLIMALLAEDFIRVQIGKSVHTAVNLTSETLVLALVSYFVLTLKAVQRFALLNPEIYLLGILATNIVLGRYVGLRFLEYFRFRKLISN